MYKGLRFCERLGQFFTDEAGQLSMTRLLMFGSFIVASIIMIGLLPDRMNEGYFGIYLGTFAASYVVGKGIDNRTLGNRNIAEQPTIIIPDAKNVGVKTDSGNVNVNNAPITPKGD